MVCFYLKIDPYSLFKFLIFNKYYGQQIFERICYSTAAVNTLVTSICKSMINNYKYVGAYKILGV